METMTAGEAKAAVRECAAQGHEIIYVEGWGRDAYDVPTRFHVQGTTAGNQHHKQEPIPEVWGYWPAAEADEAIAAIEYGSFPSLDGPQEYDD